MLKPRRKSWVGLVGLHPPVKDRERPTDGEEKSCFERRDKEKGTVEKRRGETLVHEEEAEMLTNTTRLAAVNLPKKEETPSMQATEGEKEGPGGGPRSRCPPLDRKETSEKTYPGGREEVKKARKK